MEKKINRVLAAVLILAILPVFCGSLIKYGRHYAGGFFKYYKSELPAEPTVFDDLKARITKLSTYLEQYIFLNDEFTNLNTAFQYGTGKELVNVSYGNMFTLESGELYALQPKMDAESVFRTFFEEKAAFDERGIDFTYVYAHSLLYDGTELPEGAKVFDHNLENADYIVSTLRNGGIDVIDSRDAVRADGLSGRDINNVTDYHWKHRAALSATYHLAKALNEKGAVPAAYENLAFENFDTETVEKVMLGKYGQRVGAMNVTLDDILLLTPKYETNYTADIDTNGELEHREGSFAEAVLCPEMLKTDRYGAAVNANYVYGDYQSQTHTVNENAPEGTVLVFRDSFGAPVSSFLSLAVRDVWGVDLRYTDKTLMEWVDEIKPDAVVYAYSASMLNTLKGQIGED